MPNSLSESLECAEELLRRRQARKSLLPFTEYTTPRWQPSKIHRAICTQLDRVVEGEIDRLLLLCPPQHGKSQIASRRLAAYMLGRDPVRDVIGVSATAELATEFGAATRDCIGSQEYRALFPETVLKEDSKAKNRWHTEQGGGYYAVGIGGSLFGRGGLAIIDDPFSSWEDAQSEVSRKRVWDWYTGTLYNRIRPGQPIIVIQHRMHEDDLVGKLLEAEKSGGDKWTVVELKAELDDPPWPERYDKAALERIKANTDPRQWSALYMQDPTPEDGDYFKRDWFGEYEEAPTGLNIYAASDYAVTVDDGDYTEHGIFGVDFNTNVYALDWWYGQTSSDVWIEKKCDLILKHMPMCWFGESGVIRKSVEPFLLRRMQERSAYCRLEWLPSINDKPTRARGFQARASMGKVFLPKRAPWKDRLLSQLLKFPNGKNDDAVDVCGLIGRGLDHIVNAAPKKPAVHAGASWMG
jgi:predicted phage terminase large subunit-like protein